LKFGKNITVKTKFASISFLDIFYLIRERPFNLKGGGVFVFFLKKYSDFGGGKKK
jgi:hypothetical protein